jgi:hypothetical protein
VKKALTSSVRKAERASVPDGVRSLRLLYSTVCSESQSSRIKMRGATQLSCPGLALQLERSGRAATQAELGLGRRARALGEAVRSSYFGPAQTAEKKLISELVQKELRVGSAELVTSEVSPLKKRAPLEATRLFFGASDALYAVEGTGTQRLWPSGAQGLGGQLNSAKETSPLAPTHPSGRRFLGIFVSCERPFLEMGLADSSGTPLPPLALGVIAPRPFGCQSLIAKPIPFQFLGFTAEGAVAVVGGEAFSSEKFPITTPLAFSTEFGLAVSKATTFELWETPPLESSAECTANSSLTLAACISNSRLYVLRRPLAAPRQSKE